MGKFSFLAVQDLTKFHRGGVRGIVILQVLRNIEKELGGGIKVQEFFDLIVGTRSVMQTNQALFRPCITIRPTC
jgi:hypothetical protein